MSKWFFPIKLKKLGQTADSMSFQNIDIEKEVEIPILPHVGSFGVARRYDHHKGVDLYCPEETPIYAAEDGIIARIEPWTGEKAGCSWWEETDAVLVEGESGVIAYGEITPNPELKQGQKIHRGDLIGHVKRVLKKDKGRPRSMLHLQLYKHGIYSCGGVWHLGYPKPDGLLDPTQYILEAE